MRRLVALFLILLISCGSVSAVTISTPKVEDMDLLWQIQYTIGQWFKDLPFFAAVEVTPPYLSPGQSMTVDYQTANLCEVSSVFLGPGGYHSNFGAGWYIYPLGQMIVTVKNNATGAVVATQTFTTTQLGLSKEQLAIDFKPENGYWWCQNGSDKLVTFTVNGLSTLGTYKVTAETYSILGTNLSNRLDNGYDYVEVNSACTVNAVRCWDGKIQKCISGSYQTTEVCAYGCPQNSTTGVCNPATGTSDSIAGQACYANEVNQSRCDVQTANRLNKCIYVSAGNWYHWDYQKYCRDGCSGSSCIDLPAVCGDGYCDIGKYEASGANSAWCPTDCGGLTDARCSDSSNPFFYAANSIAINSGKSCACPTGMVYENAVCVSGTPTTECGDGTCDPGENVSNCITDCGATECGDNICNGDETKESCPFDCEETVPVVCGDGECKADETPETCPADCKEGSLCEAIVEHSCLPQTVVECDEKIELGLKVVEVFNTITCEAVEVHNESCIIGPTDRCVQGCPAKLCGDWSVEKCITGSQVEARLCDTYKGTECTKTEVIETRINPDMVCEDEDGIVIDPLVYVIIAGAFIALILFLWYRRR